MGFAVTGFAGGVVTGGVVTGGGITFVAVRHGQGPASAL